MQKRACVLSCFSRVRLFATLWTIDIQAPLSMGLSRHEYWSGLSCPPSGDLPDPGIEPASLISPALAGGFFTTSATREAPAVHQSGFNPWLGKIPEEGNGKPLQYYSLGNCKDRGAWKARATVHGVARVRHHLATKQPPPPYMAPAPTQLLMLLS